MKLKSFKVKNYKVFKEFFSVNFISNQGAASEGKFFTILTGKNNMGKSTFLEAINEFFKEVKAANKINGDCFNNKSNPVVLEAEIIITEDDIKLRELFVEYDIIASESTDTIVLTVTKSYDFDKAPNYSITLNDEQVGNKNFIKKFGEFISEEQPYYIRPNMTIEEIDKLVSSIYSDAIISSSESETAELEKINKNIQETMRKLKLETDGILRSVEIEVSSTLNNLFQGQSLQIKIQGGEPTGFSILDLLKNSDTKITIDSSSRQDMLLSEQGTGVQRMSLIYIIQKLIEKGIGNLGNRMLLVDEPEAFLHPEATRGLSDSLYRISDSMPIIITTHSPILINLEKNHTIIDIFRIDKNDSKAVTLFNSESSQFEDDDKNNMKVLNYVDSYVNEFFFSDKVIIVEGSTEKFVLKYIQKEYGSAFHVLEARGKSTICTLMKILNQFDSSYYVLHDIDNNPSFDPPTLKSERTKCKSILDLKPSNAQVYASCYTFEAAFYGSAVPSSKKTQRIYEILESKDGQDFELRSQILNTFNAIFDLKIEEFSKENLNDNVHKIETHEQIEGFFEKYLSQIVK